MKKIFNILIVAIAMISVSCVNEIEEFFDTSASERLNEKLMECKELLTSPEHGWLIHYYPSATREWGGCTYAAKFETDGNVTVTSDVALRLKNRKELDETVTSHYSLKSSIGPVLSFDTYNDYIHYWSDPDIPYANKKYDGDLEYTYMEGNEHEMVFRGTKSGNTIIFTRLEQPVEQTLKNAQDSHTTDFEAVHEFMNELDFYSFEFMEGTGTESGAQSYNLVKTLNFNRLSLDGAEAPYVITPTGITFYQPVTIGNATVQKMKWNGTTLVSEDAVSAGGEVVNLTVTGKRSERYIDREWLHGKYEFTYTELSYYPEEARVEKTVEVEIRPYYSRPEREFLVKDSLEMTGLKWMPTDTYGYMDPGGECEIALAFDSLEGKLALHTQRVGFSGATNQHWVYMVPANWQTWIYWNYYAHNIPLVHNNPANSADMELTFDCDVEARGSANAFWIVRYLGPKEDNEMRPTIGMIYGFKPLKKIGELSE